MKCMPVWFKADDVWIMDGKQYFTGINPYRTRNKWGIDKDSEEFQQLFKIPVLISHPEARKDCFYKVVAIESFAMKYLSDWMPIGLRVEPVEVD